MEIVFCKIQISNLQISNLTPMISLSLEDSPNPADLQSLSQRLDVFNLQQVGYADAKPLTILARNEAGELVGGIVGTTYWGWLAIDLLWVDEKVRGEGIGHELLEMAEETAVSRNCTQVLVDTMSFQAPDFYRRNGYEIYGVLDNFAGNHQRIYLRKWLS